MTTSSTTLSISELSRRSGVSNHTLRYYEKAGVLAPTTRASNGHRRYLASDVAWLAFVLRLKATGMPLTDIKQYADAHEYKTGNQAIAESQGVDRLQPVDLHDVDQIIDVRHQGVNEQRPHLAGFEEHYAGIDRRHAETHRDHQQRQAGQRQRRKALRDVGVDDQPGAEVAVRRPGTTATETDNSYRCARSCCRDS